MSSRSEIDLMVAQLEEKLPEWVEVYSEQQFICMLAQALSYIAFSADPDARTYCVMRTGCLHTSGGEVTWAQRYGR
ncbi:hypothetical protein [Stenotrophomonas indicatrix]|uniref:hypothetical protein n=1 Tax=Stenotrophomonas indicatrix TaxID=2045451 RepID=UPI001AA12530|nr:hypothetical protein [Stenotrophomonas indicatrix]MBO1750109.1 hypothetical protein [Stenotrophomonas indicatrix]